MLYDIIIIMVCQKHIPFINRLEMKEVMVYALMHDTRVDGDKISAKRKFIAPDIEN